MGDLTFEERFEIRKYILSVAEEINPVFALFINKRLTVKDGIRIELALEDLAVKTFQSELNEFLEEIEERGFEVKFV